MRAIRHSCHGPLDLLFLLPAIPVEEQGVNSSFHHRIASASRKHLQFLRSCRLSEWWMGIEEVRIGTATVMLAILVNLRTNVGEQLAVYLVSLVGTMQTSPEVDSPACAPTSRIVALDFQSLGCGCSKLGCLCYRNLVEG